MRKHIDKPVKPNGNMIFSLKKILLITLILVVIMGTVGVMATNERVKSVKIILSSGYEMNVMTTYTKVSDILNENHIILLESELSVPNPDEELYDNNTIQITKYSDEERLDKAIENSFSSEDIINSYSTVDKIIEVKTVTVTARAGDTRAETGSKADYQAYAAEKCYARGWSSYDVECLIKLWNRESGWNVYSSNKYSGAYGIPQALPGRKMAAYGSDWQTNYKTQIDWGLSYISGRYGSPSKAWSSFCSKGWY